MLMRRRSSLDLISRAKISARVFPRRAKLFYDLFIVHVYYMGTHIVLVKKMPLVLLV